MQLIPLRHPILWNSCILHSFHIPQWLIFTVTYNSPSFFSLKQSIWFYLSQKQHFNHERIRMSLTTNARLLSPCSPNPISIFSSVARCILVKWLEVLYNCFLGTKWTPYKTHTVEVKRWLTRPNRTLNSRLTSPRRLAITVQRVAQLCCNLHSGSETFLGC